MTASAGASGEPSGGGAGTVASTTTGKKMRFGEWGGLHALRDLRVDVVG